MSDFLFLLPLSLVIGLVALGCFLWSLKSEQYEDLDGSAERILYCEDKPITDDQDMAKNRTSQGLKQGDA